MNNIKPDDARWLALFVDTEGCIFIRRALSKHSIMYSASVDVANASFPLVEIVKHLVGLGSVNSRQPKNGRVPIHHWRLTSQQTSQFLRVIYPHLIVKQRQARVAIYGQSFNKNRGSKRREYGKGTQPVPEHVQLMRQRLWGISKDLNNHRNPDVSWIPEPWDIVPDIDPHVPRGTYLQFVEYQQQHQELLTGGEVKRLFAVYHRTAYRWVERYTLQRFGPKPMTYAHFADLQDNADELWTPSEIQRRCAIPPTTARHWYTRYLENQSCFSCE